MFPLAATEEKKGEKAMNFHELVDKVRTALVVKADASKITEHIAVQVNVTGEAEGAFYIEIKDGVLCVEPYTYNDRDFLLTADGEEILAVAQGKKTLESAILNGAISHNQENWEKVLLLSSIIPTEAEEPKAEAPAEEEKPKKKAGRKPKAEAEKTAEEAPAEGQLAFAEDTAKAEAEKTAEEVPAEGQLAFAEDTAKAEEAPKAEEKPKKRAGRKPKAETAKKPTSAGKKTSKKDK